MKITLAILSLALCACDILPKSPAVHDFGLSQNPVAIANHLPNIPQATASVESPKWLQDKRIRYRFLYTDPTQIRFYTLDRWVAPPPELFEQLLNSSGIGWRQPFTVKIHAFEQQFSAPEQANVVTTFTVVATPNDQNQQPITQKFQLQVPCPSADANGAVTAFKTLTQQAVERITLWLSVIHDSKSLSNKKD